MDFLLLEFLGQPTWMWLAFIAIVVVLLAIDLGALHGKQQEISVRDPKRHIGEALGKFPMPAT
jgi:tellurite resistance protein TerC